MENINYNIIIFIIINIFIFLINNYKENFFKFCDTPKKRKLHDKPTFIGGIFVAIYLLIYLAFSIFFKIDYYQ